ncbi:MAG: tail fiber protein [Anaerolineaceae bacterium]|nr:tail fiber protein [Anaerolineaceae bacterium]
MINYQGMLTDAQGNPLETMEYKLSFSIFSGPTGGAAVWGPQVFDGGSNTGHGAKVPVVRGHFNVILGPKDTSNRDITNAFVTENAYLAITVGDGAPIAPRQRILSTPYAVRALHGVPAGTIIAFGGQGTPPGGWLHCARAAVSSEDYPALYAAIGTSWGNGSKDSDPRTDFNLPDLIGRFLRGRDYGWDRDPDRGSRTASQAGGNTGDAIGSVQGDATKLPNNGFTADPAGNHKHAVNNMPGGSYDHGDSGGGDHLGGLKTRDTEYAGVHSHTISGGDSETRPKNAYVNWFIKY